MKATLTGTIAMTVDAPVRYMDKSREYYAAHGYEKPYRWAHFDHVPFTRPRVPLAAATLGVVTTSMLDDAHRGRHRRLAAGDFANPPAALYTEDVFWDRDATHTKDRESYFPYAALSSAVDAGRIGLDLQDGSGSEGHIARHLQRTHRVARCNGAHVVDHAHDLAGAAEDAGRRNVHPAGRRQRAVHPQPPAAHLRRARAIQSGKR